MILVAAALLSALVVPLFGGSYLRLAGLRPVGRRWLVAALVAQTVALAAPGLPEVLRAGLHIGSYVCALAFVTGNRTLPGVALIAAGGAANFAAIVANGGVMPASAAALARAGLSPAVGFRNSNLVSSPRLAALGDVFPLPLAPPLGTVFSMGDLAIAAGAALLIWHGSGASLRRRLAA